jgi:hypothetical protein
MPNLNPPIRLRCGYFFDDAITSRAGRALPAVHELLPRDVIKNVFCMQRIFRDARLRGFPPLDAAESAIC